MLHSNYTVNPAGSLCVGGVDTVELAKKYGTPLFVIDEDRIREKCRTYVSAAKKHFGEDSLPIYASKALCYKGIYTILAQEGMGVDVVSLGELAVAAAAEFPMERVFFHGNGKSEYDVRTAMDMGIGYFVVDNKEELERINAYALEKGTKQAILIRLTPGIDPHTFEAVNTGKVDSKFGTPIQTGQAEEFVAWALTLPGIDLQGFQCHVGSQVFEVEPMTDTADLMLDFVAYAKEKLGFTAKILDLGGGYGVRYTQADPEIDIAANIQAVSKHVLARCAEKGIVKPQIILEPGRSIVADAGVTVYQVLNNKTVKGYKNYVTIDGGMTDNPRYALYGSAYTCLIANRADAAPDGTYDVVGRCCESGDIIQPGVELSSPQAGDYLAVLVTGAYNYSMSSNYNFFMRPPVIAVSGGAHRIAVKRETIDELLARNL